MLLLRSVLLIVLCGFNAVSAQNARSADSLVNSGWNAWFAADYSSAETQFRAALIADASCTRAHVGLALLHSMREEYIQCWDAIRGLEKQEKNIYPYLFSFGSTLRFKLKNQYRETGLLDYLIQLASAPR